MLGSSPTVIYTCEPFGDYAVTFVSENVSEIIGHQPADFLKNPGLWINLIHPDDKEQILNDVAFLFENDFHFHEYRFLHKDGSYRWMRDELKLIRDADGNPKEIVGSWTDITLRKQAEIALKESERRYRSFVQNFHGLAYRGMLNFTPIFFHGAVDKITGYTEEEFTTGYLTWDQLILPADLDAALEDGKKMISVPNYSYEREYRILKKDGQIRWVHEFAKNICDESGQPKFIGGVIYDVSDQKKIEEERQQLIDELQKALAKVKQLSGFIPICASCKKIRDDKGYWNQVEAYIEQHSDAEFSHGICPECAKKLYPELFQE